MDLLKPEYNTKRAYSSLGYKYSAETRKKTSNTLKNKKK